MSTSNCTNGLHRMGLLAVAAIFLAFAAGCGEGECDDDQTLVTYEGEDQCFDNCEGDEDCADGFECDDGAGVCLPGDEEDNDNGDNDNGDNDNGYNDNNGEECDPVAACADYCYEKSGRCLEENCGTTTTPEGDFTPEELAEFEVERCEEGFEDDDLSIAGCLDSAQLSDAACQEVEDEAEEYAEQECDGDEQLSRQCGGQLYANFLSIGPDVHDACDCVPANSAGECTTDSDCDEYGRGECLDGFCAAWCEDWGGEFGLRLLPDPTCAESNGFCLQATQGGERLCYQGCDSTETCPQDDQACRIVPLDSEEPSAFGQCEPASEETNTCNSEIECEDDELCREGNCMPSCDEDEDCDVGPCGDDDFCEINYIDLVSE